MALTTLGSDGVGYNSSLYPNGTPVTLATSLSDSIDSVSAHPFGHTYTNINAAGTTVVKSGAGVLHSITFNKPVASEVWTLYDNTAASGTKIGTITLPATLLQQGPYTAVYDIAFSTGLTIVSTGTTDGTVATGPSNVQ